MRLKETCIERPMIVVLNNLLVHQSETIKFQFDNHAFIAKYLPPQSCALNPIEQMWIVFKCEWKKTTLYAARYFKEERGEDNCR